MKLIKRGHKKGKTFRGECFGCGSVFEADRDEIKPEFDRREMGEFSRAKCTECGTPFCLYPKP